MHPSPMQTSRSIATLCALFLFSQCATPAAGRPGSSQSGSISDLPPEVTVESRNVREPTYQGLTLEEWCAQIGLHVTISHKAGPQVEDKQGRRYSTEGVLVQTVDARVYRLLAALEMFAARSEAALVVVELLGYDLEDGGRSSVAQILVAEARADHEISSAARGALARLVGDPEPLVSATFIEEIDNVYFDADLAPEEQTLGPVLTAAFLEGCARLLQCSEDSYGIEIALTGLVDVEPQAPERVSAVLASLRSRPLSWNGAWAAEGLRDFAWSRINADGRPYRGLETALQAARVATAIEPSDPYTWNTLALACWRLGHREEALQSIEKAMELGASTTANQQDGFERNSRMLAEDGNWTPEARSLKRCLPETNE